MTAVAAGSVAAMEMAAVDRERNVMVTRITMCMLLQRPRVAPVIASIAHCACKRALPASTFEMVCSSSVCSARNASMRVML